MMQSLRHRVRALCARFSSARGSLSDPASGDPQIGTILRKLKGANVIIVEHIPARSAMEQGQGSGSEYPPAPPNPTYF